MPRRLLNVGSLEESCDPFLFEPVERAPYVCLSYCWGAEAHGVLKTTKANLGSHYRAIPYASLPLTIRDAVIVCRKLQIPNLWVDSLCIVQDDKPSWLEDSAQMREIYLYSYFTIAAQEPSSCRSGFLGKQRFGSPKWQARFITEIPAVAGGPANNEIFIRRNILYPEEANERFSLDKRGWCLQECLLPNRKLCFNGNEMIWECRHRRICECGHTLWIPQSVIYPRLGGSIKSATAIFADRPPNSGQERPDKRYQVWRALVEEYSNRCLSQATDKLVAVSGLAKTIDYAHRDGGGAPGTYLAGLWKGEFIYDLTWRVIISDSECQALTGRERQSRNTNDRSSQYRAPSWSWASVDRPVRYDFWNSVVSWKYPPKKTVDCTIDEVVCQNLLPDDPTGPVSVAHAVLTGPLVPVELEILETHLDRDLYEPNRHVQVYLDDPPQATVRQEDAHTGCREPGECRIRCYVRKYHGLPDGNKNLLYCFRLFTWTACTWKRSRDNSLKLATMGPEIWFLLLRKSPVIKDAFERIGVGTWGSEDWRRGQCPLFEGSKSVTIKII